jgi:hypothetical protein
MREVRDDYVVNPWSARMAAGSAATSLDGITTRQKEPPMFTSQLSPTPIAVRHTELIADAEAARLARRVQLARRMQLARHTEHCSATAPRARRSWLRTATQPAHI